MFRDPYLLEKEERVELVQQLRVAVSLEPNVPELRVFLGHGSVRQLRRSGRATELREAARLDPTNFVVTATHIGSFYALRVCTEAAEELELPQSRLRRRQSELARRQTATIRTHAARGCRGGGAGIELKVLGQIGRLFARRNEANPRSQLTPVIHAELLQLAVLIAILLPAGKLVASLCTRFGIPPIIGELMVGIAAGPGGLNLFHLGLFQGGQATTAFTLLAQFGGAGPDVHGRP